MTDSKLLNTQTGSGRLVLKNGEAGHVSWCLGFLHGGEVERGYITGSKELIGLAARDKAAKLIFSPTVSVAVTVDRDREGIAPVTAILTSWTDVSPGRFEAQAILNLQPSDGNLHIEFGGANGEQRTIVVPMTVIRDCMPALQKVVAGAGGSLPASVAAGRG